MGKKVSIATVADQLGVSTRTVRRYVASGRLTAYRVGPRLLRVDADQAAEQLLGSPIHPV
jgi:excisionase family DNA binding protein